MATSGAASCSRPEVKPASSEPAQLRKRHLKNVSDWLGRSRSRSKDSLLPIGPELLVELTCSHWLEILEGISTFPQEKCVGPRIRNGATKARLTWSLTEKVFKGFSSRLYPHRSLPTISRPAEPETFVIERFFWKYKPEESSSVRLADLSQRQFASRSCQRVFMA